MPLGLQKLDELPRHTASQVKNKWGDVVRQVNRSGAAAVTNHSSVEMVLMPASEYEQLFNELASLRAQRQNSLDELTLRFNARLTLLQQPDAAARVEALFNARGSTVANCSKPPSSKARITPSRLRWVPTRSLRCWPRPPRHTTFR